MQLAKSICFSILLALAWDGAAVEAQTDSNRESIGKGYLTASTSSVSSTIRVDSNLGKLFAARFVLQDEDRPSEDLEFENVQESAKEADESDPTPSPTPLDLEMDEEEFDEEGQDELDSDYEPDRRPPRPVFGPWPKKGIRGISVDIRETSANAPEDVSQQLIASNRSDWTQFRPQQKVFRWVAPDIKYQPLYFEDVALERYGQTAGPYHQSLISSFHFFKDFVFLPHKMRHDAPKSCDHPLGFCRPGNSTPYTIQRHYFGRPGR